MSSWAGQGVECVCIRNTPWLDAVTMSIVRSGPVMNEYCVIQIVVSHPEFGIGLGFDNHRQPNGQLSIYPIRFFRPIVAQSDDVALFTHHFDLVGEPA